jgi:hypothetical protein
MIERIPLAALEKALSDIGEYSREISPTSAGTSVSYNGNNGLYVVTNHVFGVNWQGKGTTEEGAHFSFASVTSPEYNLSPGPLFDIFDGFREKYGITTENKKSFLALINHESDIVPAINNINIANTLFGELYESERARLDKELVNIRARLDLK